MKKLPLIILLLSFCALFFYCTEDKDEEIKNNDGRKFKTSEYEEFADEEETDEEGDTTELKSTAKIQAAEKVKVKLYVVNQDGIPADDSVRLVICKISGEWVRSIAKNKYIPGDYIYPSALKDYKSTNYKYLGFNKGEKYLIFAYSNTTSKPYQAAGFVDNDDDPTNNFVVTFNEAQDYYVKVFEQGYSNTGTASAMPKLITLQTQLRDSITNKVMPSYWSYYNGKGVNIVQWNQRLILKVNTRVKNKIFKCNAPNMKRSIFINYGKQKLDTLIYSLPSKSLYSGANSEPWPYSISFVTSLPYNEIRIRKDFRYFLLDLTGIDYASKIKFKVFINPSDVEDDHGYSMRNWIEEIWLRQP